MSNMVKPVDLRENETELIEIGERVCKILDADYGIVIPNPKVALTIAYVYAKNMIEALAENKVEEKGSQINFVNLFDIGISYRENDEAEKEGNYVPFITPLQAAINLAESDN